MRASAMSDVVTKMARVHHGDEAKRGVKMRCCMMEWCERRGDMIKIEMGDCKPMAGDFGGEGRSIHSAGKGEKTSTN